MFTVNVCNVTSPDDFVTLRRADRAADAEQAGYFYRLLCGHRAELVAHLDVQRDVLSRCHQGADQREVRRAKHFVNGLEWDVRAVEQMIERLHARFGEVLDT